MASGTAVNCDGIKTQDAQKNYTKTGIASSTIIDSSGSLVNRLYVKVDIYDKR